MGLEEIFDDHLAKGAMVLYYLVRVVIVIRQEIDREREKKNSKKSTQKDTWDED